MNSIKFVKEIKILKNVTYEYGPESEHLIHCDEYFYDNYPKALDRIKTILKQGYEVKIILMSNPNSDVTAEYSIGIIYLENKK